MIAEQNSENMLAQSSIGDARVFCGLEPFTNSGEKDFITIPEIRALSKESYYQSFWQVDSPNPTQDCISICINVKIYLRHSLTFYR